MIKGHYVGFQKLAKHPFVMRGRATRRKDKERNDKMFIAKWKEQKEIEKQKSQLFRFLVYLTSTLAAIAVTKWLGYW